MTTSSEPVATTQQTVECAHCSDGWATHVSNLQFICGLCDETTQIGYTDHAHERWSQRVDGRDSATYIYQSLSDEQVTAWIDGESLNLDRLNGQLSRQSDPLIDAEEARCYKPFDVILLRTGYSIVTVYVWSEAVELIKQEAEVAWDTGQIVDGMLGR